MARKERRSSGFAAFLAIGLLACAARDPADEPGARASARSPLHDDGFIDDRSAEIAPTASASGSAEPAATETASIANEPAPVVHPDRSAVVRALVGKKPRAFGPTIEGVVRRFDTNEDAIALTLDLCEGKSKSAFDVDLFETLRAEGVHATIFVSGRWAEAHPELVKELEDDPLFEIENHGTKHRPCSVEGESAFGIAGTKDLAGAVDEIEDNELLLARLIGRRPRFYRSGTAYFDDVCISAAAKLGVLPIGFSVSGDGGTGFTRSQIQRTVVAAKPGSIIVLHAHRPRSSVAEGFKDALPALKQRGVKFVLLSDVLGTARAPR